MKRVMLRVAYDGTDYCGWQLQPGVATVEGVLNQALSSLLGEPITVTGASRTDSGVHSLGNVAVFDTDTRIPADKICYALNQRLPDDIVVHEYRILNREFPLPTERRDSYFYYRRLDVARMREAAAYLVGTHDFASFCAAHSQAETTIRTVYDCQVEKQGDLICIRVTGAGFLYNMVRIIAGTLIEVGSGLKDPQQMPAILDACARSAAGPTAPAHGLTMIGIEFAANPCID